MIEAIVADSVRRASVDALLNTRPYRRKGMLVAQSWEEAKFDNQPLVAAITLLTKLQNDVRYAEGEALLSIAAMSQGKSVAEITGSEMIADELNAFVVPESKMVMRGGRYAPTLYLRQSTPKRAPLYISEDAPFRAAIMNSPPRHQATSTTRATSKYLIPTAPSAATTSPRHTP